MADYVTRRCKRLRRLDPNWLNGEEEAVYSQYFYRLAGLHQRARLSLPKFAVYQDLAHRPFARKVKRLLRDGQFPDQRFRAKPELAMPGAKRQPHRPPRMRLCETGAPAPACRRES